MKHISLVLWKIPCKLRFTLWTLPHSHIQPQTSSQKLISHLVKFSVTKEPAKTLHAKDFFHVFVDTYILTPLLPLVTENGYSTHTCARKTITSIRKIWIEESTVVNFFFLLFLLSAFKKGKTTIQHTIHSNTNTVILIVKINLKKIWENLGWKLCKCESTNTLDLEQVYTLVLIH